MKLLIPAEDMTEGWRLHGAKYVKQLTQVRAYILTTERCRCGGLLRPDEVNRLPKVNCPRCGEVWDRA